MNRFNKLIQLQYRIYSRGGKVRLKLCNLLQNYIGWFYHCDIPYVLDLRGVFLCHKGFGIVINPKAKIGKGTYIQHGVTIGARDDIKDVRAPRIGCNCYIGAKATIIGNIVIGDNVKIGAGAVVVSDIPSNSTAVGVPARVINKIGASV